MNTLLIELIDTKINNELHVVYLSVAHYNEGEYDAQYSIFLVLKDNIQILIAMSLNDRNFI
ncbi:hypothetical protein J21TS3_38000 [Paenibacillus cookii]|uniref:Uncharacterized protein n=1 Tax=Paenibacillus cookii TaxID=157839 RepID=A0ABQ4M0B0_9BACL|nr:hypothetical protein J21TS3_38000 [Paenibacillus cookii]